MTERNLGIGVLGVWEQKNGLEAALLFLWQNTIVLLKNVTANVDS